MSGKVWRGALVHPVAHGGERREIEVWSDLRHEAAKAEVFADAIPDMKYVFSPVYGSWLRNTWERQFDAMLGGGGLYGQPMARAEEHGKLATGFERPDPVWTNFEGRTVLRFEKGSFLQFAQGVMPRGAPYTIAFEIRPDDASDQSLIRTAGSANREAQLALTVKDGTVHLTPYGVSYYLYPDFDTKCRIKPGEWNLIVVSRDFGKFVLMVNGERREFPYDRRGRLYEGFAFAGNVAPGKNIPEGIRPFTGFLRAFRVRHLPLPPAH